MSAIVPSPSSSPGPAGSELLEIEVRRIASDPDQPRTRFDDADLDELAATIVASSLLQPIVITPNTTHPELGAEFLVLFGERRLRAAIRAGRETVPAILRTDALAPADRILLQLTENDQRIGLTLHERAQAYRRALDRSGLQPAEFARRNRFSKATLSKYLSLAAADGFLAEALAEHHIHHLETARAFARLPARYQQHLLANARRTGDPITIGRLDRATAAANAEAELTARREAAGEGSPEAPAGLAPEDAPASSLAGPAQAPAAAPPGPDEPIVQVEIPYSALRSLIRRLGAEPAASPEEARAQLLAVLARG